MNSRENLTFVNRKNKYSGKFDRSVRQSRIFFFSRVNMLRTTLTGTEGWPGERATAFGFLLVCPIRATHRGHGAVA